MAARFADTSGLILAVYVDDFEHLIVHRAVDSFIGAADGIGQGDIKTGLLLRFGERVKIRDWNGSFTALSYIQMGRQKGCSQAKKRLCVNSWGRA